MDLIMSPASPYARKVRVLIREAGLSDRVREVPVTTIPMAPAPEALAANPTGRIPALVRADGPAIYDSRVICRFLDAQAGGGFYPDARLWEVLTLEATADGMMDSATAMVYATRFIDGGAALTPWLDAHWAKVTGALAALEGRWMSHLNGPLDAGQIAVGCVLGYLDLRHDARDWRATAPGLAAWFARFGDRPAMRETAPAA